MPSVSFVGRFWTEPLERGAVDEQQQDDPVSVYKPKKLQQLVVLSPGEVVEMSQLGRLTEESCQRIPLGKLAADWNRTNSTRRKAEVQVDERCGRVDVLGRYPHLWIWRCKMHCAMVSNAGRSRSNQCYRTQSLARQEC